MTEAQIKLLADIRSGAVRLVPGEAMENEKLVERVESIAAYLPQPSHKRTLREAAAALTAAEGRIKALESALSESQASEAYQRGKAEASAKVIARLHARIAQETPHEA